MLDLLVESELEQHDWSRLFEANGPATSIPIAFRELLESKSSEEATTAYWKLENHVVLQGSLFEAALYLVPAMCAALVDFNRPKWVRTALLELMFQVVSGESHSDEFERELKDLGDRCRAAARQGLWIFYRIFQDGELWRAAKEILERVEENPTRLTKLETINRAHGRVDVAEPLEIDE